MAYIIEDITVLLQEASTPKQVSTNLTVRELHGRDESWQ